MPAGCSLRARLTAAALLLAAAGGAAAEWIDYAQSKQAFDRLLSDPDYDQVERAANELGFSAERFPTGEYHFEALYLSLVGNFRFTGPHGARLASEWSKAKGSEGYGTLAHALVNYGWAWEARTSRAARTVSPEAWELFYDYLEKAYTTLEGASPKLKRSGPWHALKLSVVFDHPKYKAERVPALKAALAAWPDYLELFIVPMRSFHPERGGSFEAMEAVAQLALESTRATHGAALYALAYERLFRAEQRYSVADSRADWPTLKQGFRDLEKTRGVYPRIWWNLAQLACQMRDQAEARRLYALHDRSQGSASDGSDSCRRFAVPG